LDLTDRQIISLSASNSVSFTPSSVTDESGNTFYSGYGWPGTLSIPKSFAGDTNFVSLPTAAETRIVFSSFEGYYVINKFSSYSQPCAYCDNTNAFPTWYCETDSNSAPTKSIEFCLRVKESLTAKDSTVISSNNYASFIHPVLWNGFQGYMCESCLKDHYDITYSDLQADHIQRSPSTVPPYIAFWLNTGVSEDLEVLSSSYDSHNDGEIFRVLLPKEYLGLDAIFEIDVKNNE
jgi:hypothetical protein